jgi:hypothetical protein
MAFVSCVRWGCTIDTTQSDALGTRVLTFDSYGAHRWAAWIGQKAVGRCFSHQYNPEASSVHVCVRWLDTRESSEFPVAAQYAWNGNVNDFDTTDGIGRDYLIADSWFQGSGLAIDVSNAAGAFPANGVFKDWTAERCAFNGFGSNSFNIHHAYRVTIRDCRDFNRTRGGVITVQRRLINELDLRIYRNLMHRKGTNADSMIGWQGSGRTRPLALTDNIIVDERPQNGSSVLLFDMEELAPTGSIVARNKYYFPAAGRTQLGLNVTPVTKYTLAEMQAIGLEIDSTLANPCWVDPSNNNFGRASAC